MPFTFFATTDNYDNGRILEELYQDFCEQENSLETEEDNKISFKKQNKAFKYYNNLNSELDKIYNTSYRKSYGGAFINGDGTLVVNVTNKNTSITDKIKSITNYGDITINSVKYAYDDLQKVYSLICDRLSSEDTENHSFKMIADNIVSVALSEKENSVIVYMLDVSDDKIQLFKKYVIDSPIISFEEGKKAYATATKMYMGHKIYVKERDSFYSIGCRATATKDGKTVKGFLTAGHGNIKGDTVYYVVSSETKYKIGTIIGRKFSNNVDCAFVQVSNSNVTMTNKVRNANGLTINSNVVVGKLPVGYKVRKYGYAGGVKNGKVIYNDCYLNYENVPMDHLIRADYKTKKGDSGGIVYTPEDGTFTGIQVAVSGEPDSNGFYTNSYYLDEQYAFSDWGGLKDIFVY